VDTTKVSTPWLVLVGGLIVIPVIALLTASSLLSPTVAVDMEQVEDAVLQYLAGIGSEYRIEEIMEFSNHFYVMVQERSTGINAFELLVDRFTGRISFEPGPNMMWNQKYGHMGRIPNPTPFMPIDAHEASQYAQRWLDQYSPGARVEEANAFYGYYTMDVSENGRIFGMMSVNGFSGDVWYHSWHGDFINMEEHD
jgi:hypothetical protein